MSVRPRYRCAIAACFLLMANGCISQTKHERILEEQETSITTRLEGEKSRAVSSAIAQTRATLTATHQEELRRVNKRHNEKIASIAKDNEALTESLKRSHEAKLSELTQQHEQHLATELEKTRVQAVKDSETKQWLAANVANIGKHQALTWAVVSLGIAALYLSVMRRMGHLVTEQLRTNFEGERPTPAGDSATTETGGGRS